MGKIIAVYGKEGSGKSTFSANLACGLAEKQKVVIILAAQLNFGGIQIFFNENIETDKGIFMAMQDKAEQPEKFLTQCKLNKNIYLIAVPNQTFEPYVVGLEKTKIDALLRKLSIQADYLIIDCTADLYNGLTLMAMAKANNVFCIYRSTLNESLWHQSMSTLISQITSADICNILSEYEIGCSTQEFLKTSKLKCNNFLPEIANATVLESLGKPIFYDKNKQSEKYSMAIYNIIEEMEGVKT